MTIQFQTGTISTLKHLPSPLPSYPQHQQSNPCTKQCRIKVSVVVIMPTLLLNVFCTLIFFVLGTVRFGILCTVMFISLFVISAGMLRLIIVITIVDLAVSLIIIVFTVVVTPRLCHANCAQRQRYDHRQNH